MNVRLLGDRVLVKVLEVQTTTASGIILDSMKEELSATRTGDVVAVGSGTRTKTGVLIPLDVAVGDRVVFGKYVGQSVQVEGSDYLSISQDDIQFILEQDPLCPART
jgi:chaperonin GroES